MITLMVVGAGCASTQPLAWFRTQKKDPTSGYAATESSSEDESPFQSNRVAKSETNKNSEPGLNETAQNPVRPAALPLNPTLQQVLDYELADSSPDERAEWERQLATVEPAVAQQILATRRLANSVSDTMQADRRRSESIARSPLVESPANRAITSSHSPPNSGAPVTSTNPYSTMNPGNPSRYPVGTEVSANYPADGMNSTYVYPGEGVNPAQFSSAQNVAPQPGPLANNPGYSNPPPKTSTTHWGQNSTPENPPSSVPPLGFPTGRTPNPSPSEAGGNRWVNTVQNIFTPGLNRSNPATATPVNSAPPIDHPSSTWQTELDRAISLLEIEVSRLTAPTTPQAQHDYLKKQVYLRWMYLMAGRQERALTSIPGIDSADQEFWQQMFWGISNYLDQEHIPAPIDRATQAMSQLQSALKRLQEKTNLEISDLAFCHQVNSYGSYERFPREEFRPGQEVLVYAEINNFKSEPTASGQYRTLLRSTIEILSPSGEVRWRNDFKATEDLCHRYRRDYFNRYDLTIPEALPLGPHILKVTLSDELSNKTASHSMNFVVR